MDTQVRIGSVETRTEALRRLAQVARESGVRLMRDTEGQMWATSASEPDRLYPLEPDSCGCRGFGGERLQVHVRSLDDRSQRTCTPDSTG